MFILIGYRLRRIHSWLQNTNKIRLTVHMIARGTSTYDTEGIQETIFAILRGLKGRKSVKISRSIFSHIPCIWENKNQCAKTLHTLSHTRLGLSVLPWTLNRCSLVADYTSRMYTLRNNCLTISYTLGNLFLLVSSSKYVIKITYNF
jgi:hypothetical protein